MSELTASLLVLAAVLILGNVLLWGVVGILDALEVLF